MSPKVFSSKANRWIAPPNVNNKSKCNAKNCKCCKALNIDNCFSSFSTGCNFAFVNPGVFNCKSQYVIYLISCTRCGIQYVGQTRQALHKRLNGHRHTLLKDSLDTYLCKHFNKSDHSFDDLSIQIIDCVDVQGISMDEANALLNRKEDFYIKVLNTVYPLGLNDRMHGGGCISRNSVTEYFYYRNPVPRKRRSHGIRRSGRKKKKIDERFVNELIVQLQTLFENSLFSNLYRKLTQLSKSVLRILFSKFSDKDNDFSKVMSTFCTNNNNNASFVNDEVERAVIVIPLNCYNVELLNLHSIFANKKVKEYLPVHVQHLHPPKIFYKLNNPISLRMCNYSKFLSCLSEQDVKNIMSEDCVCSHKPDFVYKPHGHIISGDLGIVDNTILRGFLSKGTKFRVPCTLPQDRIKSDLNEAVDKHILKLSNKYKIPVSEFSQWADEVGNSIISDCVVWITLF